MQAGEPGGSSALRSDGAWERLPRMFGHCDPEAFSLDASPFLVDAARDWLTRVNELRDEAELSWTTGNSTTSGVT